MQRTLAVGQEVKRSNAGMASRHVSSVPRGKASGLPFHAHFVDVAKDAGLWGVAVEGHSKRADYVVEAMGSGVAFLDYDNDGWLDILVLSGSRFDDPLPEASTRLYKNNRDGTFTDVTRKAGLFATRFSFGVTVGDYDNDGWEDIFITGWPSNVLYRNNRDGSFTDVTKAAGLTASESRFGTGCTFLDYDRDGRLDLFVSNYLTFDIATVPRAGTSKECNSDGVFCGPRGLPYGKHALYRNNGDGTFSDVTDVSGIGGVQGGYGLTAVGADLDGDGWPDIYLACDSTPSLFFHNNRDGTFTEQAMERGIALSEDGMEQAGMGVALGDLSASGKLDLVKTHFAADTPAVYTNDGQGNFRDDTIRSGLGVETRYISWGVGIEDFDNDGLPDVLWVTGGIYPEFQDRTDEPYSVPRIVFRNLGNGRFEEIISKAGPGIEARHCSRGCAFGDFDNDGDMDVLIMNLNEMPSLLRNDVSSGGHWLKVKLQGVQSNRSAIGARATVICGDRKQSQEVLAQSSYLSVNDRRLHFGLGPATEAAIEVRWPTGKLERIDHLDVNVLVEITEGQGISRITHFKTSK